MNKKQVIIISAIILIIIASSILVYYQYMTVRNFELENTPDDLKGVFYSCNCQADPERTCEHTLIDWQNSTHYIDNNVCEFVPIAEADSPERIGDTGIILFSPNQRCADLFDAMFDDWAAHVEEMYNTTGNVYEPPPTYGIVKSSVQYVEFMSFHCNSSVFDWGYLVNHQEVIWGNIDWPDVEPFKN